MKKNIIIIVLATLLFINLNLLSSSLVENTTWENNLIGSNYNNGLVFGDINNDGYLDMISVGCSSGYPICTTADKTYVWINNGTTFNENQTWEQNLSEEGEGSIVLGDIDNDGDLDLILSGDYLSVTKIYTNNGTTFNENQTWGQIASKNDARSDSILLGDIDHDGDLDLIFSKTGYKNTVYINNGTSFINSSSWGGEITFEEKVSSALIDLDNSGTLDLIVMGLDSAKSYLNNGTNFVYTSDWNVLNGDEDSIVSGDIDNDGDLDVIQIGSGGICTNGNNILLNDGTQFIAGSWQLEADMSCFPFGSLALGDYDNNGYLDLISFGGFEDRELFSNNGSAFAENFTDEANITGELFSSALWADVDNDWDLDLISIGNAKVYINNITTPNTPPTPPSSVTFSSYYRNREINLGWGNGSDSETSVRGLYYNLMMGNSTNNHTIISGVYGGYGDQVNGGTTGGYFGNMMQRKNFSLKVDRLQPSTTYYWYVQTIDTALKAGAWGGIQSFTTPADMERPAITLNSPENSNFSNYYNVTFNATVSDNVNLTNVSLWGNWTGSWHLNETNNSLINNTFYTFTINLSSVGNGYYMWMIEATDNQSNSENSSTRVFTIDTVNPSLNISTSNNTNSSNTGLDIIYFSSDINRDKCWYGKDNDSSNTSLTDCANITTVTWAEGIHNLTIWVNDSAGNTNSSYLMFTIDTIYPSLNMSSPANNTNSTDSGLDVKYFASDTNLDKCWYSNDTYSVNTTLSSCANITAMVWSERVHNLTIWVNDSAGNTNSSYIKFTVDNSYPIVNLTSPINGESWSSSSTVTFTYNVSDIAIVNCSLIIAGAIDQTDTTVTVNTPQTFTKSLSNADYSWSVNCTDVVNYVNNSDSETVTVSYTSSTTPSSGGGGGGGSATYWTNTEAITEEQFSKGIEKELSAKQRVQVVINNEAHYVGIISIDEINSLVTVNVSSTPIQFILGIGQDVKLDVNNDSFYDIYLKVENIISKKVNLTIKEIHEQIAELNKAENETISGGNESENISGNESEVTGGEEDNFDNEKAWAIGCIIVIGILIVSIFLFFLIKHLRKKNRKK